MKHLLFISWSKKHNTINCPAGHHFYEGRWIRDNKYLDDYARFYYGNGGDPGGVTKVYSNWLIDGIYARFLVNWDSDFVTGLLDSLISNHKSWSRNGAAGDDWQKNRLLSNGLFWQIDSWEGTEFSIGGTGIRPLLNSYMYASAIAIGNIGEWIPTEGTPPRGKDYNHSTFCDLVITGLAGLRPRADNVVEVNPLVPGDIWDYFCLGNVLYDGELITIVWDRMGEKYGVGRGLQVFADGEKIAGSRSIGKISGKI